MKKNTEKTTQDEDEDYDDGDVVYTQVTVKSKEGNIATIGVFCRLAFRESKDSVLSSFIALGIVLYI